VIGLSLALELRMRGHGVTVIEARRAMRQASWAAAGMLAAEDPHNPAALLPLSRLSVELYAEYLRRVEALSGKDVPFQTESVVEHLEDGRVVRRAERSVDPRQLGTALVGAVRASGVVVVEEDSGGFAASVTGGGVEIRTERGLVLHADCLVHAAGAWSEGVRPRKGQMLRVAMPPGVAIEEVHRRADVYLVPRTKGPQAGTALIGATVEDVGFDLSTRDADLEELRRLAAELVPVFGDAARTPMVEAWAGVRPGTPDGLPLIGALRGSRREFVATGHFRNGILLAPATAVVVADLIEGRPERVDLGPFQANRFASGGDLERRAYTGG
jgi:glycine oxidase